MQVEVEVDIILEQQVLEVLEVGAMVRQIHLVLLVLQALLILEEEAVEELELQIEVTEELGVQA